jgi:hypothetical protein
MMKRTSPIRRQSRLPVRWPIVYGCEEFLSEGTVLDVTQWGWRVAGAMPVQPGMRLTIHLWPQDKPGHIRVEQATVLWVKGCEFALDVPELAPDDRAWMSRFLDNKLSLWLIRHENPLPAPQAGNAERSELSKENVPVALLDVTEVRTRVLQGWTVCSGAPRKTDHAAFACLQRDAERIVNGILGRQALRARTGQDSILTN